MVVISHMSVRTAFCTHTHRRTHTCRSFLRMWPLHRLDVCVFGPEGHASLATYWAKESLDFMRQINLSQTDAAFAIPLFLHEDGVPSFKDESYAFWSWSSLSQHQSAYSRCFVVGLPSSRVLPSTRATICEVLAWDLANLAKGVRPSHDHRGKLLQGNRALQAGLDICGGYTAHFSYWKGDMEAMVAAHNLSTRHYRHLFHLLVLLNI